MADKELEFKYTKNVPNDDGSLTPLEVTLKVPNLHIAPIPYIAIQNVQVDFQMEVTSIETSKGEESTKNFDNNSED